jgi:conjugal transfer pilus assembly protein TraL
MAHEDLSHYIPRRLDSDGKFLFWDLDVAAIGIVGMMVGLGAGYTVLGLIGGCGLAFAYGKLKAGKHPGMAAHLLYWWTGLPQPRDLPGSHLRELNG